MRTKLIETLQTTDMDKRAKSAVFSPKIRNSGHLHKVIKENPGNLLVSGATLHEAIDKTFTKFVHESKKEIDSHRSHSKNKSTKR